MQRRPGIYTGIPTKSASDRESLSQIKEQSSFCHQIREEGPLFPRRYFPCLHPCLVTLIGLKLSLGYSKYDYKNKHTDSSRNGYSCKRIKSSLGDIQLSIPHDRNGEFEPQIVKKNQTTVSADIEEKILYMYAKGMSTTDIESPIRDIYGLSVSDSAISRVTDKILPIVREWQQRPL